MDTLQSIISFEILTTHFHLHRQPTGSFSTFINRKPRQWSSFPVFHKGDDCERSRQSKTSIFLQQPAIYVLQISCKFRGVNVSRSLDITDLLVFVPLHYRAVVYNTHVSEKSEIAVSAPR
jgi:hypothetical protein